MLVVLLLLLFEEPIYIRPELLRLLGGQFGCCYFCGRDVRFYWGVFWYYGIVGAFL